MERREVIGKLGFGALAVVVVLAFLAWAASRDGTGTSDTGQASAVTMDDYMGIRDGMARDAMLASLRSPGTLASTSQIGGHVRETYVWQNPDGSRMVVLVDNGEVSGKEQTGLR